VEDSRFYLIGEGEDRQKINEYCAALNLSESVILTGSKKPEDGCPVSGMLLTYLSWWSYKEGWSPSLMESLAAGFPSCVTDFSSASEIIADGVNAL
jgi:glycosyltransferase involved in cell wall biosynthesis